MAQATQALRLQPVHSYNSFAEFFSANGVNTQIHTIDPSRHTVLVGQKGTRFTIFPYSMIDASGTIQKDPIDFHFKEVFTKSEMVLSNKVTTSEDRLLESSGQIWVQAFKNGTPLQLKTSIGVQLPVRNNLANPLGSRLFCGSLAITRTFSENTAFDWRLSTSKAPSITKLFQQKYFEFKIDSFNWYNCDAFYAKRAKKTMVSIQIKQGFSTFDELVAFLLFRNSNAVTRMYANGQRFTSFNIPAKKAANVLVMGLKNGQLFSSINALNKIGSQLLSVSLVPTSTLGLKEVLNAL